MCTENGFSQKRQLSRTISKWFSLACGEANGEKDALYLYNEYICNQHRCNFSYTVLKMIWISAYNRAWHTRVEQMQRYQSGFGKGWEFALFKIDSLQFVLFTQLFPFLCPKQRAVRTVKERITLLLSKNVQFARTTKERIPNPGFGARCM